MATIALVTANKVEVVRSVEQHTAPCAAAITAGFPIQLNTAGKWIVALATSAGAARGCHIATRTAVIGEGLTGIRQGLMDGWDLSALAYNAQVFLSDTGTIADAAGTGSYVLGLVRGAWAQPLGTASDKILYINPPPTA